MQEVKETTNNKSSILGSERPKRPRIEYIKEGEIPKVKTKKQLEKKMKKETKRANRLLKKLDNFKKEVNDCKNILDELCEEYKKRFGVIA